MNEEFPYFNGVDNDQFCDEILCPKKNRNIFPPIPDTRIMEGAPRMAIESAITDHTTAGALAVYARLLGKAPPMPYA